MRSAFTPCLSTRNRHPPSPTTRLPVCGSRLRVARSCARRGPPHYRTGLDAVHALSHPMPFGSIFRRSAQVHMGLHCRARSPIRGRAMAFLGPEVFASVGCSRRKLISFAAGYEVLCPAVPSRCSFAFGVSSTTRARGRDPRRLDRGNRTGCISIWERHPASARKRRRADKPDNAR